MDGKKTFEDGDVVWVKLGNCWWPGEICSESELPKGILKAVKKRPLYIVRFFEETKFEYVKNINNICKYNDSRKNDFIKKGLDLLRANKKYMEKFPTDVSHAERLTDGDENIISSEQFSPVKKISYSSIFGNDSSSAKKKNSGKRTPGRNSAGRKLKMSPTMHSSPPVKANMIITNMSHESPRLVPVKPPVDTYNCKLCSFTTSRCNIMIIHMKTHTKTMSPSKDTVQSKQPEEEDDLYLSIQGTNTSSETHETEDGSEADKDATDEEESKAVVIADPPKKRKTPKKPGLKHLILADWSEDDEEEENVTKAGSTEPAQEDTRRSIEFQTVNDIQEDRSSTASAEKTTSTVMKYRNIPKKDRRDIILSEFEAPQISTIVENEKSSSDTVAPVVDEMNSLKLPEMSGEILVDTESPSDMVANVEVSISKSQEANEHDVDPEKSPTVTAKGKPSKTLSCFDFKDDDEDVTDDFLSSLSKLKQKYLSPDKKISQDLSLPVEEDKKEEAAKDLQLTTDIENLLNATATPELSKVVGDSVSHDVRALPPKERGKRIFKSRNRPLSEPERERQSSTESSQKGLELNASNKTDTVVVDIAECKDTTTTGNKSTTDEENVVLERPSKEPQVLPEPTEKDSTKDTLQTDIVAESIAEVEFESIADVEVEPIANVDVEPSEEQVRIEEMHDQEVFADDNGQKQPANEMVCADDTESIDSTVVEVSDGNSNLVMTDSEHDLNALAAAETLISIPSKLHAENLVEAVANLVQYPNEEDTVTAAQSNYDVPIMELESQSDESPQLINTTEIETNLISNVEAEIPGPAGDSQVSKKENVTVEGSAINEDNVLNERPENTTREDSRSGRRTRYSSRNRNRRNPSKQMLFTNEVDNTASADQIPSKLEEVQEKPARVDKAMQSLPPTDTNDINPTVEVEPQLETHPTVEVEPQLETHPTVEVEPQLETHPTATDATKVATENLATNVGEVIEDQPTSPAQATSKRHKRKKHKKPSRHGNKRIHIENLEEASLDKDNRTETVKSEQTQPSVDAKASAESNVINCSNENESPSTLCENQIPEPNSESPSCANETKQQVDLDLEKLDLDQLQDQHAPQASTESQKYEPIAPSEEYKCKNTDPSDAQKSAEIQAANLSDTNDHQCIEDTQENSERKSDKETISKKKKSGRRDSDDSDKPEDISPAILLLEELAAGKCEDIVGNDKDEECVHETLENANITDSSELNENAVHNQDVNNGESANEERTDEKQEEHELNAAEQILDEISNLTSSIDIILDAERADDDQLCLDEDVEKQIECKSTEDTSLCTVLNDGTVELTVLVDNENLQADELVEPAVEKTSFGGSDEELKEGECKIDLQPSPNDASNISEVGTRKRKSHLKYIPPKVSVASEPIEHEQIAETANPIVTSIPTEITISDSVGTADVPSAMDSANPVITPISTEITISDSVSTADVPSAMDSANPTETSVSTKITISDSVSTADVPSAMDSANPIVTPVSTEISISDSVSTADVPSLTNLQSNVENSDIPSDGSTEKLNESAELSINVTRSNETLNTTTNNPPLENRATDEHKIIETTPKPNPPLTLNSFSFDTEPLTPSISQPSYINRVKELMANKNKRKETKAEGTRESDRSHTNSTNLLTGESKMSSKRRLSKLKEQVPKPSLAATEDIQERIKVYSFDDQADGFETPKKAKYSTSKENKSEKHNPKVEIKGNISSESTKTHTSSSEKSKHSRSRQVNLHNLSDVRIPKFPKIDRSKRQHMESGESVKTDTFEKELVTEDASYLDVHIPTVYQPKPEMTSNMSPLQSGNAMSTAVNQVSPNNVDQYQANLPMTTSLPSTLGSSAKRKPSKTSSTQSRKAKQQVSFQTPMHTPSLYDPYSPQQTVDLNAQHTVIGTMDVKVSPKDKQSPRPHAGNIQGSPVSVSPEKRGHIISSQTVVMSTPNTTKGHVIKTCAGDPLFITSKGNLIPSNPSSSTYSSGYYESVQNQQRMPETVQTVSLFPSSQSTAQETSSHSSPTSSSKRASSGSTDIAQDSSSPSKSACNLAEIKRLDQKPVGKVLTAHGFNELEMIDRRLLQGKMSVRDSNVVVDMPVLVPIGEPHTPARMPVKRCSSHHSKDSVTTDSVRVSKQVRTSPGNSVQQQSNMMTGNTNFESTGSHLMRDHTSDNVEPMFGQQQQQIPTNATSQQHKLHPLPHHQRVHQNQRQQQQQQSHYQLLNQTSHDHQTPSALQQNQLNSPQQVKVYQQQMQTEQSQANMRQLQGKRRRTEPDHHAGVAQQQKKVQHEQQKQHQLDMHHKQMKLQQQEQQPPKLTQIQPQYKIQSHDQQSHQMLQQPQQQQQHQAEQEQQQQQQQQQLQLNQQLHHEQQLSQEQQLQLHLQQELQLQQEQQLQLEQHLQQQQQQQHEIAMQHEQQEIVIQQADNEEAIIGNQLLVQDGTNTFFVDLKNIVAVMNNEEGEITGVQLASGETLFVTQSVDEGDGRTELEDQTIQIDGQHLLLTDATALEDGIEVPGQEILVQSIDREVYQDGQLIGNVLQIETSEGIKLVEPQYQLINAAKAATTNETNAIMPPIMSALEIPSSKSELVINNKSNETGLIGQNLDDSLAVIGVTSQSSSSAVRSSLELPITITNPAIAPKTSNSMNIGNMYGTGMQQQNEMSSTLSSQDPSQLTYDLFTSSNNSRHHGGANMFNADGTFKNTDTHSTQLPPGMDDQCLNEIILHSAATAGTADRTGGIIQQSNDFIISSEQVCEQFAVVENQATSDAYCNQTR